MGFFSNFGAGLRARKRVAAAVLGGLCIALAAFFAGAWTGSSGTLTLTSSPANAPAPRGPNAPQMPDQMHGKRCCDGMKDMMQDMPNMPMTPGQMPTMPGHMPMTPGNTANMPTH
jgi:hypothetical protein